VEWNPDRVEAEHRLFSFLICEASGIVGPVHLKAMPVLLTTPECFAMSYRIRSRHGS
jgi:hypothetical protein